MDLIVLSKAHNYLSDISILRIIATISVIFLHTNSTLTDNRDLFGLSNNQYLFFLCVYRMLYWAVPVFFMITGSLLLKKEKVISYEICIKKYCKRILLALFIFGIPFSIMELFVSSPWVGPSVVLQAAINVIKGRSFGHLWYLLLIGIYLVLPFLKSATDNMDRKAMKIFLIILFLFNFCIPGIGKFTDTEIAFGLPFTTFSIFYIVCGNYIEKYVEFNKRKAAVGFAVMLLFSAIVALISGNGDYLGYDSPIIGMTSVFIFLLFKGIHVKSKEKQNILWRIDRLCFGAYLIHPIFIHFVYRFLKFSPVSFDWYWLLMPGFGLCFVVLAFVGSWVMSLIKPLRKYVL